MPSSTRPAICSRLRPAIYSKLMRWPSTVLTSMTLVMLGISVPASASLGGDLSSVQTDQVRMRGAVMQVANRNAYTVHEMRAESGTIVREFVSQTGTVFAVAWQGPSIPDLRQVLGMVLRAICAGSASRPEETRRPRPVDDRRARTCRGTEWTSSSVYRASLCATILAGRHWPRRHSIGHSIDRSFDT